MVQQVSQRPSVILNKGLITEAGELTFPEGASVDELNCTLERDGSRRRRLGVQYESGYQLGPTVATSSIVSTHQWENAGGSAGLTFVVVQIDATLHFYLETTTAISANKKSFTVDLTTHERAGGLGGGAARVQTTVIEGVMVVASSELNTFQITYDPVGDSVATEAIVFKVRDFVFQGDVDDYQDKSASATVSVERQYDTKNAGWKAPKGDSALSTYISARTAYPPLSLPWYAGKDASGNFSVSEWEKIFSGTSLIANGSYILNLYTKDREGVSGVTGIGTDPEESRFVAVQTFAGRVFYAGMENKNSNRVFFSRLFYQTENLGDCYQVNDPTSEDFSDLLDTDGGEIAVPGAYGIKRLHVLGPYLIIFAENGIWSLNGVDNVFRATDYALDKVSEIGIQSADSFVSAEGRPYWWSDVGIHTIEVTQQGLVSQNISLPTIQTFWGDIDPSNRDLVQAAYDKFNRRVAWFYPSNGGALDRVLFFDEALAAFYPWSIGSADADQYIVSPFFSDGRLTDDVTYNVIDSSGNTVVDAAGDPVVITLPGRVFGTSQLNLAVRDTTGQLTFAEFSDTQFYDWGTADYSSYVIPPYDFSGDMTTKKRVIYVKPYFRVTEVGTQNNGDGSVSYIRPSGCLLSSFTEFSRTAANTAQQAYRVPELIVTDGSLGDLPPATVVTRRLRLRGRGSSMYMKFESEEGKDFHLLGFDLITGKNPR